jgi:hypothetical protein
MDPAIAGFAAAGDFGIAQAAIERDVLDHSFVGIEQNAVMATLACPLLDKGDQQPADTSALGGGRDREIVEQEIVIAVREYDKAEYGVVFDGDCTPPVAIARA